MLEQPSASMQVSRLFPLLLIIVIDCMGFGFIFPVLTPLLIKAHHLTLPTTTHFAISNFNYGIIVAVYPLCMFFGAPMLGDLSDKLGRKRVLLICLCGTAIGYAISGFGVQQHVESLIIFGRVIDGITAGSLSLAQAAIADLSSNEKLQIKYMAWMMFAIALGQIFGPMIAGIFSDISFSSLFSSQLPFYIAAVLSLFNIIWLLYAFNETYIVKAAQPINLTKTLRSYKDIFHIKPLLHVVIVFLCMQLCWSCFSQAIPAYIQHVFSYGNFQLGVFSAMLGVFIAIGGMYVLPQVMKRFSVTQVAKIALFLLAIGTFIAVFIPNQWSFWFAVMITSVAAALAFPSLITLFSATVDQTRQGWVMGITGSIIAFAWGITGFLSGIFLHWSYSLSIYLGAIIALLGGILIKAPKIKSQNND